MTLTSWPAASRVSRAAAERRPEPPRSRMRIPPCYAGGAGRGGRGLPTLSGALLAVRFVRGLGPRDAAALELGAHPAHIALEPRQVHRGLSHVLRERSEEHTSELQSHSFISYAVFC